MFETLDRVRHVKSGVEYLIISGPDQLRIEATGEPAYAYRRWCSDDHRIWVRPQFEMEDGRFEVVE